MALLAASPAGDAGGTGRAARTRTAPAIATDQRGQPRAVDGNSDGVARCDLGAYEAAAGTFPSPTTTTTSTSTTSTTTTSTSTTTTTRPSTTTDHEAEHHVDHQAEHRHHLDEHVDHLDDVLARQHHEHDVDHAADDDLDHAATPADACGGCAFDDPGCCQVTAPMAISTARLLPGDPGPIGGFGLRAELATSGFTGVDPRRDDVIVQLSTAEGQLLCATIPHALWRSGKREALQVRGPQRQLPPAARPRAA